MKKILNIIFMAYIALCFTACFSNRQNGKSEDGMPSPEVVEYMKQFNTVESIESAKLEDINIKVFQTLNTEECLAAEISDKEYGWYYGNTVYYLSGNDDLIYDDKIIKEKAYLIGTYTYETRGSESVPSRVVTVKAYTNSREIAENIINFVNNLK
jgi:hypothetical protein